MKSSYVALVIGIGVGDCKMCRRVDCLYIGMW